MSCIVCPSCRLPLNRGTRSWTCAAGHVFDVAREGYVNLLLAQHKNSREPGDNPAMIRARRHFLQAGHYAALRQAVVDALTDAAPHRVLDIGCGEGYYTSALAAIARETVGLDIAKTAVQLAARRYHGPTWLVASGAQLPLADAAADVVTSLFCPVHAGEIRRVLAPGGRLLLATPAADHLWQLRAGLFEEVRPHEPDKFIAEFGDGFELHTRREIRAPLALDPTALRQLLQMTPYVWKARPERRAALEALNGLQTEAAFVLLSLRKAP